MKLLKQTNADIGVPGQEERCLTCYKPKCNNCLTYYTPPEPTLYIQQINPNTGRLDGVYDTVIDASEATGIGAWKIFYDVNKGGTERTGYIWKVCGSHMVELFVATEVSGRGKELTAERQTDMARKLGVNDSTLYNAYKTGSLVLSHAQAGTFMITKEKREVEVDA